MLELRGIQSNPLLLLFSDQLWSGVEAHELFEIELFDIYLYVNKKKLDFNIMNCQKEKCFDIYLCTNKKLFVCWTV